jgi:probable rRNA maturation factor
VSVKFLQAHRDTRAVSIVFVGDTTMHKLNKQLRGKDRPTDVLSFRETDSDYPDQNFLGEVMIDYQQIKRQAKHGVQNELIFILVHGLLHLRGYNDDTDQQAAVMDRLTKKFLQTI